MAETKYRRLVAVTGRQGWTLTEDLSHYYDTVALSQIESVTFKIRAPEIPALYWAYERYENLVGSMDAKSRMERGFYCFFAPYGYRYEKAEGGGKIFVRDGGHADIVQEAYEGLASGRFQSQGDVKRIWRRSRSSEDGRAGTSAMKK